MRELVEEKYLKLLVFLAASWSPTPMRPAKSPQDRQQLSPQVLAGRTLRMMRQWHGVRLTHLADEVGISASHLSRVESGERAASADLIDRICDVIAELPAPKKSA
jgi:DNA-binding Xre family transcriptional regulator